jgi:hypothetical protein
MAMPMFSRTAASTAPCSCATSESLSPFSLHEESRPRLSGNLTSTVSRNKHAHCTHAAYHMQAEITRLTCLTSSGFDVRSEAGFSSVKRMHLRALTSGGSSG